MKKKNYFIVKTVLKTSLLFLIISIIACRKWYISSCDESFYPYPAGVNEVLLIKGNDTLEFQKDFSYVIGKFNYNFIVINISFNEERYPVATDTILFNGMTKYEMKIGIKKNNNYKLYYSDILFGKFKCDSDLFYNLDTALNYKLNITKYEAVGGFIKGSLNGFFTHYKIANNDTLSSDTLKVICNFNALRWCD